MIEVRLPLFKPLARKQASALVSLTPDRYHT
jgi:hypothetical protein